MTRVSVRRAEASDAEWVFGELEAFAAFYGTKKSLLNKPYAAQGVRDAIENHLVFVAEKGGEGIGFILGLVHRHPFNPDIRVLSEHLWWVKVAHRHTRAGAMLLDAFTKWGKAHVDWVTFGVGMKTAISTRSLERRGFRHIERTFLLEVE